MKYNLAIKKNEVLRNALVVQRSGLHVFTAKGAGSFPGWGTKIPASHVVWQKNNSNNF